MLKSFMLIFSKKNNKPSDAKSTNNNEQKAKKDPLNEKLLKQYSQLIPQDISDVILSNEELKQLIKWNKIFKNTKKYDIKEILSDQKIIGRSFQESINNIENYYQKYPKSKDNKNNNIKVIDRNGQETFSIIYQFMNQKQIIKYEIDFTNKKIKYAIVDYNNHNNSTQILISYQENLVISCVSKNMKPQFTINNNSVNIETIDIKTNSKIESLSPYQRDRKKMMKFYNQEKNKELVYVLIL